MSETLFAQRAANQIVSFRDMANAVRALAMDAVAKAKSEQPGMPMGMAAVAAQEKLAHEGVKAAVVSMPRWQLFECQSDEYRRAVLRTAPRIGFKAALRLGWDRLIGKNGAIVGMKYFGASALAGDLYKHFGITTDAVVDGAQSNLGRLLPNTQDG